MLDLFDMLDGVLREFLPPLQLGDVPDRLEHVDGVFEKTQDIGGVEIDPVFERC